MDGQKKDNAIPLFGDDFIDDSALARPVGPEDLDDFDDWILDYSEESDTEEPEKFSDLGLVDEGVEEDFSDEAYESETPLEPQIYIAHYVSPTTESPVKGFFEFESVYRASSKQNHHDARIHMLELFGKEAVSWVIDEVKLKRKNSSVCGDQMELDFREPKKPRKRRKSKKYW